MENDFEKTTAALSFDDSDFVALCHADMWTNNHMYSYHKSGTPKDALLVKSYSQSTGHLRLMSFAFFRSIIKAHSMAHRCQICSTTL